MTHDPAHRQKQRELLMILLRTYGVKVDELERLSNRELVKVLEKAIVGVV